MNSISKEIQATRNFQPGLNSARAAEGAVSRRAQLLVDRIELSADVLASFVAGLSETEWNTPVSVTDRRSIGVIVHHVVSVYPIEIELAKAIASGSAVAECPACAGPCWGNKGRRARTFAPKQPTGRRRGASIQ